VRVLFALCLLASVSAQAADGDRLVIVRGYARAEAADAQGRKQVQVTGTVTTSHPSVDYVAAEQHASDGFLAQVSEKVPEDVACKRGMYVLKASAGNFLPQEALPQVLPGYTPVVSEGWQAPTLIGFSCFERWAAKSQ
jgi:hypothetical protein